MKTTLRFYEESIEGIQSGQKTDTWRHGDKSCDYEVDQTIDLVSAQDDYVFGQATITDIRLLKLMDADDQTATLRGYTDKQAFIASFKSIYPDIQPDDIMTIIHFKLC